MLHTKMCSVRTYVKHKSVVFSFRAYTTDENVKCLNLWCTRKYDVSKLMFMYKMCNIRTYVTHEYEIIFCPN